MIYTLTVNPSLDYIVDVKDFETGKVNRTFMEQLNAGGKGINVSMVLKNLGFDNTALGFTAGFTGEEIQSRLQQKKIATDFINLGDSAGFSRINVKLRSNTESEINGQGPAISSDKIAELYGKLDGLKAGDILVLAGSIPNTLPETLYSDIMGKLEKKEVLFVVDATKDLLTKSLCFKPFLIKPNNHELGEIFGVELKTRDSVVPYAQKLLEQGAQNVLVSMAGEGAVLVCGNGEVYKSPAPKCTLVNSVGAGDSMVAGFIAGWLESQDYEHALKMGLAAGSASASMEGLAELENVQEMLNQL